MLPTQEDFLVDLAARIHGAVQATIELVLDEELEILLQRAQVRPVEIQARNVKLDACGVS